MKAIIERLEWIEAYLQMREPSDSAAEAAWEMAREIRAIAETLPEQPLISKLELGPGDILVMKVEARLDKATAERLAKEVHDIVGPDRRVIVLDESAELSVLTAASDDRGAPGHQPIIMLPST